MSKFGDLTIRDCLQRLQREPQAKTAYAEYGPAFDRLRAAAAAAVARYYNPPGGSIMVTVNGIVYGVDLRHVMGELLSALNNFDSAEVRLQDRICEAEAERKRGLT